MIYGNSLIRNDVLVNGSGTIPLHVEKLTKLRTRPSTSVFCQAAKKGFGTSNSKGGKPATRRAGLPSLSPVKKKLEVSDSDWIRISNLSDFQAKNIIPVELKDKSTVVLYKVDGEIFCSDANSTAYKYPLVDARIFEREGQPTIEVPFDGTTYNLRTGKVLEWCPKNNPLRLVLGALKEKESSQDLRVYPVKVDPDGSISAKFSP
eukprot:jgi/Botrbrau1/8992/Bobra.0148s0095.1